MRTLTMALLASLFSVHAFAVNTGFETGNEFTARLYRGQVSVSCISSNDHSIYYYNCSAEDLDPAQTANFVIAPGVDADQVALTSTWENGKTVDKNTDFDSTTGKSKKKFNLWISTLFQRPLLDFGTNKIHYVLSKDGKTQSEGDFTATVKKAPATTCRPASLMETFAGNCQSVTVMCQRYFQEVAQCD